MILKKKRIGIAILLIGLIGLSMPWIIFNFFDFTGKLKYIGEYHGTDRYKNEIEIEIKRSGEFIINVSPCDLKPINGTWQYIKEFASIWVYVDNHEIDFYIKDNGEIRFNSDILSNSCDLTELDIEEK